MSSKPQIFGAAALASFFTVSATQIMDAAVDLPPGSEFVVDVGNITGADIGIKIHDVLTDCESEPRSERFDGCDVRIPAGTHRITETIVICRAQRFHGDSGSGWGHATRLSVAPGVTAFRIGEADECLSLGYDAAGGWAEIRDIEILAEDCTDMNGCGVSYGVNLHAQAHLENVRIKGFTQGIRISAGAGRAACTSADWNADCKSNANRWSLDRVMIEHSSHAGVYVDGPDANAGYGLAVNSTSACLDPDPALGECAAIVDSSFLGNTWTACHTAGGNTGTQYRSYLFEGNSQRSTVVGAYAESNQLDALLARGTLVFGGLSKWEHTAGGGFRMDGQDATGTITIHNDQDPANVTDFTLGFGAGEGSFFSATSTWATAPLRLKVRPLEHVATHRTEFLLDIGNLGSARALGIRALGPDAGDVWTYNVAP